MRLSPRLKSSLQRLGCGIWILAWSGGALLHGAALGLPIWLWVLLIALLVPLQWPTEGLLVAPVGLSVRTGPFRWRRYAWAEVSEVAEDGERWRIETPAGTRWLRAGTWRSNLAGKQALSQWRAAHGITKAVEPQEPGTATPEEMRAWLGLQPGEMLSGWRRCWYPALKLAAIVLLVFCLVWQQRLTGLTWEILLMWCANLVAVALGYRDAQPLGFAADEHGLAVRANNPNVPATWLSWSEVRGATRAGRDLRIETTDGAHTLSSAVPNLDRLATAIAAIVAAREAGAILPRLVDGVPEAALSRASVTEGGERGLSVSRDAGSRPR